MPGGEKRKEEGLPHFPPAAHSGGLPAPPSHSFRTWGKTEGGAETSPVVKHGSAAVQRFASPGGILPPGENIGRGSFLKMRFCHVQFFSPFLRLSLFVVLPEVFPQVPASESLSVPEVFPRRGLVFGILLSQIGLKFLQGHFFDVFPGKCGGVLPVVLRILILRPGSASGNKHLRKEKQGKKKTEKEGSSRRERQSPPPKQERKDAQRKTRRTTVLKTFLHHEEGFLSQKKKKNKENGECMIILSISDMPDDD